MPAKFAKHLLNYTDGPDTYSFFFLAPPNHYTGIEAACGVSKLPDESDLLDMPVTKTEELTISPIATRKTLRVKEANKLKYVDIVVASTAAITVTKELVGKAYKGGTIERVLDSRKRTRY